MRATSLLIPVLLSLLATLLSALPVILSHPPGQLLLESFGAGLPFQWYIQPASQGTGHCGPTGHCTPISWYRPTPSIDVLALLLDIAIYAIIAAGIVRAYESRFRGLKLGSGRIGTAA